LYTNDLPLVLVHCLAILFADDITLCLSGRVEDLDSVLTKLTYDVQNVLEWMSKNGMEVNLAKTDLLVIGSKSQLKKLENVSIQVNGTVVTAKKSIKLLGTTIDSELKWSDHVNSMASKVNKCIYSLYPLRNYLSFVNLKTVVDAYCLSNIKYVSIIYGSASKKVTKIAENCVRRAARLVLSLYYYEPVKTELTTKLQWLLPVSDYNYKLLLLLYTIINGDCPPYFTHTLGMDITLNSRTYNLKPGNLSLNIFGDRCLTCAATQLWNSLPLEIKSIPTFPLFKKRVKLHLLKNQLY